MRCCILLHTHTHEAAIAFNFAWKKLKPMQSQLISKHGNSNEKLSSAPQASCELLTYIVFVTLVNIVDTQKCVDLWACWPAYQFTAEWPVKSSKIITTNQGIANHASNATYAQSIQYLFFIHRTGLVVCPEVFDSQRVTRLYNI